MNSCENCNCETKKLIEVNAENYKKRFKSKKNDKIFVCKRCLDEWKEREFYLKKITKEITEPQKDKKIILAGPGTGKTYLFQEYIKKFSKDDPIYIVTFINNLVDDLRKEIKGENIKINTFHKFCYHLLQLLGKNCLYCPNLTDLVAEDSKILRGRPIDRKKIRKNLNYYKATVGIKFYFERGKFYNAIGNDNIFFALLRLENSKGIDLRGNYKQIIVDEYQDFNFAESRIIRIISQNNKILIAGDDDQALYTFKDSSPNYIRELWDDPDFSNFKLPFCHRCTEVIVDSFNYFIRNAQKRNLLKNRKDKPYKCYFPDKYRDCERYSKIFWYKTAIRSKNFKGIENILISNIKKYVKEKEIEVGKLNFLILYPDTRASVCKTIKENTIKNLQESGVNINRNDKKIKKDKFLSLKDGYIFLKKDKDSNLGWRIVIKNDPFEDWEETIKLSNTNNKTISELLPINYKKKHLKILQSFTVEEKPVEIIEENGINLLFTNFYGSKGLSADHVFVLFPQNGVFPVDPSNIMEDEIYKFLVAITRSKKSLNFITANYHQSVFINMLPQNNIKYGK